LRYETDSRHDVVFLSVAGNDDNACCECNDASELEEPDDDRPREPNPNMTIVIAVAVAVAVVVAVVVVVVVVVATATLCNRTGGDIQDDVPTIEELRARLDAIKASMDGRRWRWQHTCRGWRHRRATTA